MKCKHYLHSALAPSFASLLKYAAPYSEIPMPFTIPPCSPCTAAVVTILVGLCVIQGCASSTDSSNKHPTSEIERVVELCVKECA